MKVRVDITVCEAKRQCNLIDPALFSLDSQGYSNIGIAREVPDGDEDQAEQGMHACPVQALSTYSD
ncbi:ferredoxin [Protofrankia coriariae]|uniref:ferredoxin n=1 Tax=Protofrankia coriariae TaxID=1562887 RepID=UPI000A8D1410|nr:ferredoxin [Protofrankia coriariae]